MLKYTVLLSVGTLTVKALSVQCTIPILGMTVFQISHTCMPSLLVIYVCGIHLTVVYVEWCFTL